MIDGVTVRPLEWKRTPDAWLVAEVFFGRYCVERNPRDGWCWGLGFQGESAVGLQRVISEGEAKAAAQADYEARILSAVAYEAAKPVAGEAVAVIGFYPNECEPRLISWNAMPYGEHALYPASRIEALEALVAEKEGAKDGAYAERNQCVGLIAKFALAFGYKVGIAKTAIEGWSEGWHGCVYMDLPTGQVSWHYHDSDAGLFAFLPAYDGGWDGHSTPEKYERVNAAYPMLPLTAEAALAKDSGEPTVEIRRNDDGSIDEVVATGVSVHLEQMGSNSWYLGLDGPGDVWQFWLTGKRKTTVGLSHEHSPVQRRAAAPAPTDALVSPDGEG